MPDPIPDPTTLDAAASVLWGPETAKALQHTPAHGRPLAIEVVRWLARIKAAAARVNGELGVLDPAIADRIARAADDVAAGRHDRQFPLGPFQTGSGTSSNMNVNEVIAALAGDGVDALDHVNRGQSSNDVFPSAVHLAALELIEIALLPVMVKLGTALEARAADFADVVKAGRTHLMDAVPVTLGQEFGGYAAQIRHGCARLEATLPRLREIPLGGTATGTGLNTHPEFARRVGERLSRDHGLSVREPMNRFEAQACRDALVEISGALKVVAVSLLKIANDLRWMASGPRAGLAEVVLPALQKGSSIMPGKTNPVVPEIVCQVSLQVIGNDLTIALAGSQGQFELNTTVPLIARNLLDSIKLLAEACDLLTERCVQGLVADVERCAMYARASLSNVTALNPVVGYERAAVIAREAADSGRPLDEVARAHGVPDPVVELLRDPLRLARPHER